MHVLCSWCCGNTGKYLVLLSSTANRNEHNHRLSTSCLAVDTAVFMPALAPLQYFSTAPVRKRENRFEELFM